MTRNELSNKLHKIQSGRCFICGDPLNLDIDKWEVDHIIPRSKGGKDDDNNYALTHEWCNRNKSDSDLRIARLMAKYEKIKDKHKNDGPNRPNLKDIFEEYGGSKFQLAIHSLDDDQIEFKLDDLGSDKIRVPVYADKLSKLRYFFALLPIEYLFHDERINPRGISSHIKGLVDAFFSGQPQLHVSLAWAKTEDHHASIHIFDGQHKAAAQVLLGIREIPVRVFINPNFDILLEANTKAGTTLRQVAFDKSVERRLGSQLYWEKIDEYRRSTKRQDDDLSFTEHDLIHFFKGQHREIKRYILDDIRTATISDPENLIRDYVEWGGKGKEKPLSYSTIEKTFYSFFIFPEPMQVPLNYKSDLNENPRQLEKEQLRQLMSTFAEEVYVKKYDFDRGTHRIEENLRKRDDKDITDHHLRAVRMSREEIVFNFMRYIRDCIKKFYLLQGITIEDDELFQQKFNDVLWESIRRVIKSLAALPIWINRDATVSSSIFGGKQTHDYWKHIFESGNTPSGQAVLAKAINLDDLLAERVE